ncbi:MAG: MFS transporter [Rhodospirillales bacterium]|nr:MAG: MFS transporter [Rhodospirillales bacterium]
MEAQAATFRQDGRVLGLVCGGHFMSHIYLLALPPLFPLLQAEMGLSYAELGLLVTVFYAASGIAQMPVGLLVDRIGGPLVVALGLGLEGGSFALMGLAQGYAPLLALAAAAGIGHSVFHPADFAILSATIDERRVGKAFSLHTSAGHLGTAVSPALMIFLAAVWDWRGALAVVGLAGLAGMVAILAMRDSLTGEIEARRAVKAETAGTEEPEGPRGLALFLSRPMLLMLAFFICTAMISSGVRAFSVAALGEAHATPMAAAAAALTAYLFASIAGVLAGGYLADRLHRHDISLGLAFAVSAAIMVVVALVDLPAALLLALFLIAGFLQGTARPQRDMLVRARATRKTLGRAYGYVSTGASAGGGVAPILFGWILDLGHPEWVFYGIALVMGICLLAVALDRQAAGRT